MREDAACLPKLFGARDGCARKTGTQRAVGGANGLSAYVSRRLQHLHRHALGEAVQKPQELVL